MQQINQKYLWVYYLCHLHKETGLSLPDISLLIPLSEILDISLYELLSGEKTKEEKVDDTLKSTINYSNQVIKRNKKRSLFIYLILGILCLIMLLGLIILITGKNNEKNTILYLWENQDNKMNTIKKDMNEIAQLDESSNWIKLKDINIEDKDI